MALRGISVAEPTFRKTGSKMTPLCWGKTVLLSICLLGLDCRMLRAQETMSYLNNSAHPGGIRQLKFIGAGEQYLTIGNDQAIRVWQTASGDLLHTYYPPAVSLPYPNAVAVSPPGDNVVISGFNFRTNQPILLKVSLLNGEKQAERMVDGPPITSVGFLRGGEHIAYARENGTIQLTSANFQDPPKTIAEFGNRLNAVAISPESNQIAVATADHMVRVIDPSGKQLYELNSDNEVRDLTFASDGASLGILDNGANLEIRTPSGQQRDFVRLDNQKELWSVGLIGDSGYFVAGPGSLQVGRGRENVRRINDQDWNGLLDVSRNGELVATANQRGQVFVWTKSGDRNGPFGVAAKAIPKVRWATDTEIAWETSTGENLLFSFDQLHLTPDRPLKSIGAVHQLDDVKLRIEESVVIAQTGDRSVQLNLPQNVGRISCYSLINKNLAVVASTAGYLTTFRLPDGSVERNLFSPGGSILDVAISREGRYLIGGSKYSTISLWDITQKAEVGAQSPLLSIVTRGREWIAYTPEGYYAATPGGDDLLLWRHTELPDHMAEAWDTRQFEGQLFRPHVVANLLSQGSLTASVKVANSMTGTPKTELVDLRMASVEASSFSPPTVEWIEPSRVDVQTTDDKLPIKFRVTATNGTPVSKIAVLINSRIVKEIDIDPGETDFEFEIPLLKGTNMVSVVAWSQNGITGQPPVLVVERLTPRDIDPIPSSPEAAREGILYIAAIGISKYDRGHELKYAHLDAIEMADAFQKRKGTLYKEAKFKVVTDEQADATAIKSALAWAANSRFEDTVIIVISGHGAMDTHNDYYVAPYQADFEEVFATWIPWSTIVTAIKNIPANRVLLFVDTCHAGGIVGAGALERNPIRELLSRRSPPIVFSSSDGVHQSFENDAWQHGAFSKCVLDVLANEDTDFKQPADGHASIQELSIRIEEQVKQLTSDRQVPTYFNSGVPDFPVVKILP